jgi:hypothetical protein
MKLNRYQQAQFGYVRAEAQRYQDTVQPLVAMGGGMTRCFIRSLLPAVWLRRPSLVAQPAAGVPIPKLSNRLREKADPSLLEIKLYGIVYKRPDDK